MGKINSIFQSLYAKWSSHKDNVIEQRIVLVVFLVLLTVFSSLSIRFLKLKTDATSVCPFPIETDNIHGQIIIVPTSTESVFDCGDRDITIAGDGEVIVRSYINMNGALTGDYGAEIIFKSLTIEHGGKFQANGQGYSSGSSDGGISNAVVTDDSIGGSGGGHGGAGGAGQGDGINSPGEPGSAYGVSQSPAGLGGAGATSGNGGLGGNGGGSIKLTVSGILNIDGFISSNGSAGQSTLDALASGGGGAGGSLWINADTFMGHGTVTANGGNSIHSGFQGGGGGGGRIQMFCNTINYFTGTVTVSGGVANDAQNGGEGTILGPTCRPNVPTILKQYKLNLSTVVPIAGTTSEASFFLASNLSDSDLYDLLYLEVEVRPLGTAFTNQVTHSQVGGSINPQSCTGTGTSCGRVEITGLTRSTQYHWQARTRDSRGGYSNWVSFGGNSEDQADISISGQPSMISQFQGISQSGVVNTTLPEQFGVRIIDANSLPVAGYSVSWSVINGSNGGGFIEYPITETDANGEAFISYRLGQTAGVNNVRATASGLTGSPMSFTVIGLPDVLDHFIVTATDAVLVNVGFNTTVYAYDQFNNLKNDFVGTVFLYAVNPLNTSETLPGILAPASVDFAIEDMGVKVVSLTYNTISSIKVKALNSGSVGYSSTIAVVLELGSCPDADGIIDTSQNWVATTANNGIFDCSGLDIRVINNAVLTLTPYDNNNSNYTDDFGAIILANNFIINAGSSITSSALGYRCGVGPGYGGQAGASYGGMGGYQSSGIANGDVYNPVNLGSGGGCYGSARGGGAIKLVAAGTVTNNGVISVNGTDSIGTSGAASGGSVWISTQVMNGTGTIQSIGGGVQADPWGSRGGGGSGGRVSIFYSSGNYPVSNPSYVIVRGGYGGYGYGGGGTVYIENSGIHSHNEGALYVDNNGQSSSSAGLVEGTYHFSTIHLTRNGNLTLIGNNSVLDILASGELSGDTTIPDFTVEGTINAPNTIDIVGLDLGIKGARTGLFDVNIGNDSTIPGGLTIYEKTWAHQDVANRFIFGDVNVLRGSNLSFKYGSVSVNSVGPSRVDFDNLVLGNSAYVSMDSQDNGDIYWTNDYGFEINATNINIAASAQIDGNAKGYSCGRGAGYGGSAGASYGGMGGNQGGSIAYGEVYKPVSLGSGGGCNGGATGGGAVKLVASGTLTHNGLISVNGTDGVGTSGAGSGGSVLIETQIMNGVGVIQSNGANVQADPWGSRGGGGSGGRISIFYTSGNYPLGSTSNQIARGGYGGYGYGGAGTVYIENTSTDTANQGKLYVDNNGQSSSSAGLVQGVYRFTSINLTNRGNLTVIGNGSILNLSSSSELQGDTTIPDLIVEGTVNASDNFDIIGVDLVIKGAKTGLVNLNLGNNGSLPGGLTIYEKTWAHQGYDNRFIFGDVNVLRGSNLSFKFGSVAVNSDGPSRVDFNNLVLGNSAYVTVDGQDNGDIYWTNDYGFEINATNITIAASAHIDASARGYTCSRGAGYGGSAGASYGGYGGYSSANVYGSVYEPIFLGSGGGCNGEAKGGGAIKLVASGTLTHNGLISVNGTDGVGTSGAGSGGSVFIQAQIMNGIGVIQSNGANVQGDPWGSRGGGGAGGRISIFYGSGNYPFGNPSYTISRGGYGGYGYGGAGTIYIENLLTDTPNQGKLFVDNNSQSASSAGLIEGTYYFSEINMTKKGNLTVDGNNSVLNLVSTDEIIGDTSLPDLTVEGTVNAPDNFDIIGIDLGIMGARNGLINVNLGNNGTVPGGLTIYEKTWAHQDVEDRFVFGNVNVLRGSNLSFKFGSVGVNSTGPSRVDFGNLVIGNAAYVLMDSQDNGDNYWTNDYGFEINAVNISIAATALVDANARGYGCGRGPGYGGSAGASYGGYGGYSSAAVYGDVYKPINMGSGGGCNGDARAGGAMKFVTSGTFTHNGLISTNGTDGVGTSGGASGGSVLIQTQVMDGVGVIQSNGAGVQGDPWGSRGGGGAGGRISIFYNSGNYPVGSVNNLISRGGYGGYGYGGAGTVYVENLSTNLPNEGRIYVDNNSQSSSSAGLVEGTYHFSSINLTKKGNLTVAGNGSVLNIVSSSEIHGDTSLPDLTVEGTVNAPINFDIIGIDLGLKGSRTGLFNLNLGNNSSIPGGLTVYEKTWAHGDYDSRFIFGDVNVLRSSTLSFKFGDVPVNSVSPSRVDFGNLVIGNSATVYPDTQDNWDDYWTNDFGFEINATNITIAATALIDGVGRGYTCDRGAGYGGQAGSSFGGYGGYQSPSPYGNMYYPLNLGSGGGCNGSARGGGAIKLVASEKLTHNGLINMNGTDGVGTSGGATGGSVLIETQIFDGTGVIQSNGGRVLSDPWGSRGGGGSGGRISIYYTSGNYPVTSTNNLITRGSYGGYGYGGPGTIYYKKGDEGGSIRIENNNITSRGQNMAAGDYYLKDVYIGNNILMYFLGDLVEGKGVKFNLTGNFYLGTGARIDGVGQGYPSDRGTGAGQFGVGLSGGGGGGYGGGGGAGQSDGGVQAEGGRLYNTENQMQPELLGSGGGHAGTGALGGSGGGAVVIDARYGDIELFGNVDVSGTDGKTASPGGGGGSGGSLLLIASGCFITGDLRADGGDGGNDSYDGGGGGGGRISILLTSPIINCYTGSAVITVDYGLSSEGEVGQVGTYPGISTLPQIELSNQAKADGEVIPIGGIISESQVKFTVLISDPGANINNPKRLVADFEIVEDNQNFIADLYNPKNPSNSFNALSNTLGKVAGITMISSSTQTLISDSPFEVTVQLTEGLVLGQGYKWRARVRDMTMGTASSWVAYGNNGEAPDFVISTITGFEIIPAQTTVEIGVPMNISIRATDNVNGTVVSYAGTALFSSSPDSNPAHTLPSNYTFGPSNIGAHTFLNQLVFFTTGIYTVTVSDSMNPDINGTSVPITVYTNTTPTPSPMTDNVLTLTPSEAIIYRPLTCADDPNQDICQFPVEISNVTVTVDGTLLTAKVCWDTNIATVGVVNYGKSMLSNSSDTETIYVTSHCTDLLSLQFDTGYNFKITATSLAGRSDAYNGTFIVGTAVVPKEPIECIVVENYSFNAESQMLLSYYTAYNAMCNVDYKYLGGATSVFKDIEESFMAHHLSKLNLTGLIEGQDLTYDISCKLSPDVPNPDSVKSCEYSGTIARKKIEVYLPETGAVEAKVDAVVPAPVALPFLFGLFWFRRKPKKGAWGLVYDRANRKPIPFAVVRLYDTISNRVIKEEVTSIDGKYNFLVGAGTYTLVAEHSLYTASQKELKLTGEKGEIAEEMPLIKRSSKVTVRPRGIWPKISIFLIKYNNYLVLIGFIFSAIATFFTPMWYNFIVLGMYVIQEILLLLNSGIKWARVIDKDSHEPIPGAFVRLFDLVEKRQIEVTLTDNLGRYKFLTKDGQYLAVAYQTGYVMASSLDEVEGSVQKFMKITIKRGITKDDIYLKRLTQ